MEDNMKVLEGVIREFLSRLDNDVASLFLAKFNQEIKKLQIKKPENQQ